MDRYICLIILTIWMPILVLWKFDLILPVLKVSLCRVIWLQFTNVRRGPKSLKKIKQRIMYVLSLSNEPPSSKKNRMKIKKNNMCTRALLREAFLQLDYISSKASRTKKKKTIVLDFGMPCRRPWAQENTAGNLSKNDETASANLLVPLTHFDIVDIKNWGSRNGTPINAIYIQYCSFTLKPPFPKINLWIL